MAPAEMMLTEERAILLTGEITGADREALRQAVRALEGPNFTARLSALAGRPLEVLGRVLPSDAAELVSRATATALRQAMRQVLKTVPQGRTDPQARAHQVMVTLSGAVGGAFGIAAIPVELPISTAIMLRAIVRIAQHEGEDLRDPETALACLQVFALGGRSASGHLHESTYFAVRTALARSVMQVARQVAERGMIDESAAAIIRLLTQIGSRFGVTVSQKITAQAVPILGALSGAAINAAFISHYQALALGHFTVRRLERIHGRAAVQAAYRQIQADENL